MQDQGDERLKQMDEDVKSHGKKHSFLDTNVMRSCHVRDERSSRTCRGVDTFVSRYLRRNFLSCLPGGLFNCIVINIKIPA